MSNLTRSDPLDEMMSFRNGLDRFFDRSWMPFGMVRRDAFDLALDLSENDDAFVVETSIPGVNPDNLEITYTDRVLTIKGETKEDTEKKEEGRYHLRERRFGSFCRSISLPAPINEKDIQATYENGVLNLRLPKSEEAKPKKIPIKSGGKKIIDV